MAVTSETFDFQYSILLVGDTEVGKTALLTRFVHDQFSSSVNPTIGIDFKLKIMEVLGKKIKLRVWDSAGQGKFKTITTSYYRGVQGVVICFALNNRSSFTNITNWLQQVRQLAPGSVDIVIVGCKHDCDREVTESEGNKLADDNGCKYTEVSAQDRHNVNELFKSLTTRIHENATAGASKRKDVQSTIERNKFLQSAYEVRINGAKSWYNKNKINGRYVPQISKDGQLLLDMGRFCYWNVDSPHTMMVYRNSHWVIKKGKKELARVPTSSIQCFPDTASLSSEWSENYGIFFTRMYPQPDIKCRVLEGLGTSGATGRGTISYTSRISVADIFESSTDPNQRGTINMNMFIQYSKEPEQMGLTIPLFVKCCKIKIAILELEYKSLKKSFDYVTMAEVRLQKSEIEKTCAALLSTVSMQDSGRIVVTYESVVSALEDFLIELNEHYELLCDPDNGNFEAARRCKDTQEELMESLENLMRPSILELDSSKRATISIMEGDELTAAEEDEAERQSSQKASGGSSKASTSPARENWNGTGPRRGTEVDEYSSSR